MKQIIYLGGKKAREYGGEPKVISVNNGCKWNGDFLPSVDVIGDCDWKKGEVKTLDVDYEIMKQVVNESWQKDRTVIVPIPKKQEGESQSDLWRALVCSVQIAAKEADKIDWNNDEEKELFIWEQIANQFTITRKS